MIHTERQPQDIRSEIARRIADTLHDGQYVNLGIGIPTLVADHIPSGRDVVLHSENGILGMTGLTGTQAPDPDLIDAGKRPVQLIPGAALFDQTLSFVMIRGGHIDVAVLGAFEVSSAGDLANWSHGPGRVSGVGGGMDLAVGARAVVVATMHRTRDGADKLVRNCTLPLTAAGVVDVVYTDLGTFIPAGDCFRVRQLMPGVSRDALLQGVGGAADLYRFDLMDSEV